MLSLLLFIPLSVVVVEGGKRMKRGGIDASLLLHTLQHQLVLMPGRKEGWGKGETGTNERDGPPPKGVPAAATVVRTTPSSSLPD